jgi:hypothetical protein
MNIPDTRSTSTPLPTIVCVGTGRDGTISFAQMIQSSFDDAGKGQKAFHEWLSAYFYNNWCDHKETGDTTAIDRINNAFSECSIDCIVGNGYAQILPIIAERSSGNALLIHLKRRDRDKCVASLADNASNFPTNHLYYAPLDAGAINKRMAAFHFGEVSRNEWDSWPLIRKFYWYYDKTHSLIDDAKSLFKKYIEIETETLNDEKTRVAIAFACGLHSVPRAVHVNRHVDLSGVSEIRKAWVQSFLGKFDVTKYDIEPAYGIAHALNEFTGWIETLRQDCLNEMHPSTGSELEASVQKVKVMLQETHAQLDSAIDSVHGSMIPSFPVEKNSSLIQKSKPGDALPTILLSLETTHQLLHRNTSLPLELIEIKRMALIHEAAIARLEAMVIECTAEKQVLEDLYQDAAQKYEYIRSSRSFKVTAPLRLLMTAIINAFRKTKFYLNNL